MNKRIDGKHHIYWTLRTLDHFFKLARQPKLIGSLGLAIKMIMHRHTRSTQWRAFFKASIVCCFISAAAHGGVDTEIKSKDPKSGAELEGSVKTSKNPITGKETIIKKSKVKKERREGDTAEITRTEKTETSKQGDTKTTVIEEEKTR